LAADIVVRGELRAMGPPLEILSPGGLAEEDMGGAPPSVFVGATAAARTAKV
jgi:hypothetical protein